MSQIEELFCDFVGLRLFGEGYLHSFAYFLAPNLGSYRSRYYPPTERRAEFLEDAAAKFGVRVPERYGEQFKNEQINPADRPNLYLDLSGSVTSQSVEEVLSYTEKVLQNKGVSNLSDIACDKAFESFRMLVPAEDIENLGDIINAGWRAYLDDSLWEDFPEIQGRKTMVVNELVLKSIEVHEINTILENDDDTEVG